MVQQPPLVQDLLITQASGLHSDTPHLVGLLWTSDQPDVETSTWQHSQETDIHALEGFEHTISAGELSQTHALDRSAAVSDTAVLSALK